MPLIFHRARAHATFHRLAITALYIYPRTPRQSDEQEMGQSGGSPLSSSSLDIDALTPVLHRTGEKCEYVVKDSAAYTAFRVRVRAHTMVQWGPWGPWSLVTTKGQWQRLLTTLMCAG